MLSFDEKKLPIKATSLESLLPPGLFDTTGSPGEQRAATALKVLEGYIKECAGETTDLSRRALLQAFHRPAENGSVGSQTFVKEFFRALAPDWFQEIIEEFDDDEREILFKQYLIAHETWGRPEGVGTLVRLMLENAVRHPIRVVVRELEGESRKIPSDDRTRLSSKHSRLGARRGESFVLGNTFLCRPRSYSIDVGVITPMELKTFQERGWAVETNASGKLQYLIELAEPFFLHGRVVFLIEETAFVLGEAKLRTRKLGMARVG